MAIYQQKEDSWLWNKTRKLDILSILFENSVCWEEKWLIIWSADI